MKLQIIYNAYSCFFIICFVTSYAIDYSCASATVRAIVVSGGVDGSLCFFNLNLPQTAACAFVSEHGSRSKVLSTITPYHLSTITPYHLSTYKKPQSSLLHPPSNLSLIHI